MTNTVSGTVASENALVSLAVETWRMLKLLDRLLAKMDAGEGQRYIGQARYFKQQVEDNLEAAGLKLVNVEGQMFDPGMAAAALNLGDFMPEDELLVDQMIEPIIMGSSGVRKEGTVMLRRVHS